MTENEYFGMKIGDSVFDDKIGWIHRVPSGWLMGGEFVPYGEGPEKNVTKDEPKKKVIRKK